MTGPVDQNVFGLYITMDKIEGMKIFKAEEDLLKEDASGILRDATALADETEKIAIRAEFDEHIIVQTITE
jgi:hypothetical protein